MRMTGEEIAKKSEGSQVTNYRLFALRCNEWVEVSKTSLSPLKRKSNDIQDTKKSNS